ncbi:MAG: sulfite exporter TauE/SafE family protein [Candidatus Omnitrophota bacterium]
MITLYITAATIGFLHTVFGPDHYVPFIVMAKARKWPMAKTAILTFLCGLGHIMSSIIIGFIGIVFGIGVMKLKALESFRGNIAGWLLIIFGFTYFVWGLHKAFKNKPHKHLHSHMDDDDHAHIHSHEHEHAHIHDQEKKANITPWILFTIFVFGPCEPLIPLLMYPAAKNNIAGVFWVTAIFGAVTIATMFTIVMVSSIGVRLIPLGKFEKYTHAMAGGTILLCGIVVQFLGI